MIYTLIILFILMSLKNITQGKMIAPVSPFKIRNDRAGSGVFGAGRGNRKHAGIDIECVPGEVVVSPISGTLKRVVYPYRGNTTYKGADVTSGSETVRIFYFVPDPEKIGKTVQAGERIGIAQDITKKYPGSGMKPHLHIEVIRGGKKVNPTSLFT